MENNLQNKARFFAQYWGQEIVKEHESDIPLTCNPHIAEWVGNFYLSLKNLSEISDEDCIELGKIFDINHLQPESARINFVKDRLKILDKQGNILLWLEVFDFLRRQSYLISFDGATVEEILNFGWAKCKTD